MRAKLKQIRKELGLTQDQFANELGISRSHYSQIETGDKNPSFELARKIKGMLNHPGDDIFDEKPPIPPEDEEQPVVGALPSTPIIP